MTDATRTRGGVGEAPDYATMTGPEVLVALDKALARAEKAEALVADYEEAAADKRRLTRQLDVAMHGEEGAAKQASLCDLIDPAMMLRSERDLLAAKLGIAQGVARAAAKGDGDSRTALIAALARVRELEEGLREMCWHAHRWDGSPNGEIVSSIEALLAPKQEAG